MVFSMAVPRDLFTDRFGNLLTRHHLMTKLTRG
jgi:hypothetical protein